MIIKVLKPIRHNGKRYQAGANVEIDEKSGKRLITLGVATSEVNVHVAEKAAKEQENTFDKSLTSESLDDDDLGTPDDMLSDDEVYQLIWNEFKLDALKEQSAEIGLEFAGNISKGDLINLIIENEKEDYFLDQIPE